MTLTIDNYWKAKNEKDKKDKESVVSSDSQITPVLVKVDPYEKAFDRIPQKDVEAIAEYELGETISKPKLLLRRLRDKGMINDNKNTAIALLKKHQLYGLVKEI